jgi:SAM-dependent methyltransferase
MTAALGGRTKRFIRSAVPLWARRHLAILVGRQRWLGPRYWWAFELLRDYAERDPDGFHRFLWANHLAYAESYEVERRFGQDNLHPTRRSLFDEMERELRRHGLEPSKDVKSAFEVGCSLGYLLRHLETGLFASAGTLEGNDIDGYAIEAGSRKLQALGSKVRLHHADMADLSGLFGGRQFDVMIAAGVLMYLREPAAAEVVRVMLQHTSRLAVFAGLAHPEADNRNLEASALRHRDGTWIHNIDAMVERGGGSVVARRWGGSEVVDGNTIYFVLAEPAR